MGQTYAAVIADLTVGAGAGQIKTDSPCRSQRIANCHRLLVVEPELGKRARSAGVELSRTE